MSESESSNHGVVDFVVPECKDFFEILYEDHDILLINKPSRLLSLSGKNPLNWDSVHYRLVHGQEGVTPKFPKAKIPHRLDFGTSGIMVVGLNADSTQHLNKQFQTRTVEKRYIAMLEGWVRDDKGQITGPIAKDKRQFPRVKICHSTGKQATSDYKVLSRLDQPPRTIVEFNPLSGRTHQLRIHSQMLGHPILGCDLYNNRLSEQMANRLLLHATELFFEHPVSGKSFHGQCDCPF